MAKVLKIVSCYPYSEDRNPIHNSPTTYSDWEKCIRRLIKNEELVDYGVDMDIILYRLYKPGEDKDLGKEFIHSFKGKKIGVGKYGTRPRGTIKVIDFENVGKTGFNIIKHAVETNHKKYDYLTFEEDDVSICKSATNYLKLGIDQIKWSNNRGIVVFAPIRDEADDYPLHFGGFHGIMPMENLYKILDTFPDFASIKGKSELEICDWYIKGNGLTRNDIMNLVGFSNYPDNWEDFEIYHKDLTPYKTIGKYLYHIGK